MYDFNGVKISVSVHQDVSLYPVTFWHLDPGFLF